MQLPNGYRSVYSFPVTFIVKYLSGTERHARLSLPYQATLVSVLLSRTKVIYVRAASVYLSAPAPSVAESSQTGSGGAHQSFPAGGKNWVPAPSQPAGATLRGKGAEGRSGAAKTLPSAPAWGEGSSVEARGRAVPARTDIPGQKGLKQSLGSGLGHLHRRQGLRCEFREGVARQRGAGSSQQRLRQVPAMVSLGHHTWEPAESNGEGWEMCSRASYPPGFSSYGPLGFSRVGVCKGRGAPGRQSRSGYGSSPILGTHGSVAAWQEHPKPQ